MIVSLKIGLAIIVLTVVASCSANATAPPADRSTTNTNVMAAGGDAAAAKSATSPAPPSVFLDTTYEQPRGRTIKVAGDTGPAGTGKNGFQDALEQAQPGDVVELEAGGTFSGNFTLPAKRPRVSAGQRSEWITVRSSAYSRLPPPGTRVTPAAASVMAKVVTPNSSPVLKTAGGANHYRFVGIEFGIAPGVRTINDLIILGDGGRNQTSLDEVPHDLIIDRCYIHGNETTGAKRGVGLHSARTSIIDSYISEFHVVGQEAQAVCGWAGPGPYKIVNNYLEAAGENIMFGGADPKIANLVPSDIEIRRNHCFKPLSWRKDHPSFGGSRWTVKNILELKNARRVLVEGNVFENCWVDAQVGFAIVLTPRNSSGTAPWSTVEDVTFRNNIVRRAAGGVNMIGTSDRHPSQQLNRVLIQNNVFEGIGAKELGGNGRLFQVLSGTANVTIDRNTCFQTATVVMADGTAHSGFVFTNNICPHSRHGVFGSGASVGMPTLEKYFPGAVFEGNVLVGGRSSLYPAGNYFPKTLDEVGFVDSEKGNYRLSERSSLRKVAGGGPGVGCDMDALERAVQQVVIR